MCMCALTQMCVCVVTGAETTMHVSSGCAWRLSAGREKERCRHRSGGVPGGVRATGKCGQLTL